MAESLPLRPRFVQDQLLRKQTGNLYVGGCEDNLQTGAITELNIQSTYTHGEHWDSVITMSCEKCFSRCFKSLELSV